MNTQTKPSLRSEHSVVCRLEGDVLRGANIRTWNQLAALQPKRSVHTVAPAEHRPRKVGQPESHNLLVVLEL